MQKFVHNPSKTHTLLFKAGSIEIPPGKAIPVHVDELQSVFKTAKDSGQVMVYNSAKDVPMTTEPPVVKVAVPTESRNQGLTAEELKVELANRKTDPVSKVVTTAIGVKEDEPGLLPSQVEVKSVVPVVVPVVEPEVQEPASRRGRKPKNLADAETQTLDS